MKQLERMIREELLSESNSVCASLFVPAGSVESKMSALKELVVETTSYLASVYSAAEVEAFIKPLAEFTKSDMGRFSRSTAFFRSMGTFRALSIPIDVEKECFVANHFHVKPLLKWLQEDRDFYCLDFSSSTVDVLKGDSRSFKAVGSLNLDETDFAAVEDFFAQRGPAAGESLIFVSGDTRTAKEFCQKTRLPNIDPSAVGRSLYHSDYKLLWRVLNDRIRRNSMLKVKKSLRDYNVALMRGQAKNELEDIIEAAKNGEIKKLIVSEEDKIWGRFDAYKNHANRVNKQTNYEDDDLLDSISEKVLECGGEVVMASKKHLPKDKPLLAILRDAS